MCILSKSATARLTDIANVFFLFGGSFTNIQYHDFIVFVCVCVCVCVRACVRACMCVCACVCV